MSGTLQAFVENDNALWVLGLRNATGAYVTDATVQCTAVVKVAGSVSVSPGSFPITLSYQSGVAVDDWPDGNYLGTLPAAVALEEGESYEATIVVNSPAAQFTVPFVAAERTTR